LTECRDGRLDNATAETHFALIEYDGLARCHRSLRLIEANQPAALGRLQCAVLVRLAIADLGCEAQGLLYVHGVDPIDERARECTGKQPGVIITLADYQYIAIQILAQHIPGVIAGPLQATDAQPLTLTYGVVHQAVMATDDLAVGSLDLTGLGGQIAFEKVAEAALADEADAGRILLACGRQLVLFRDAPHLGFFQLALRKQGACKLLPTHGVQEVALVFVGIDPAQQQRSEERRVGKECRARWAPERYKETSSTGASLSASRGRW